MRKIASAILLSVIAPVMGIAQTKTYEVKSGDTLGHIATRFGVSTKDLIQANGISNSHKLKLGQKLRIPKAAKQVASKTQSSQVPKGAYKVRNGDNDWGIAARMGTTVSKLHAANPGVNWKKLQIGQTLRVPVSTNTASKPVATLASTSASTKKWGGPTTAYRVKSGDNDWTLARKFNISLSKLKALNPGVNTAKLKIGQYLRVPGTASAVAAKAAPSLNSRYAVINRDSVIVRSGASTSRSKVTTVDKGTQVTVLDKQNEWYKLKFPKGTIGWVRGDMLKASSGPVASKSTSKPKVSTAKAPVAKRNSRERYASYVGSGSGSKAVDHALGMLGTRYRYGSASRSGTDCSGLVLQAFKAQGVKLPRTSRAMSGVGASVSKDQLKPGDLVFFRTRGNSISHVGIYKGNGKFVHSSSGQGRVTVSSLNEGYYSRRYAGARRVVKPSAATASKPATNPVAKVEDKKEEKVADQVVAPAPTKGTDEIVP